MYVAAVTACLRWQNAAYLDFIDKEASPSLPDVTCTGGVWQCYVLRPMRRSIQRKFFPSGMLPTTLFTGTVIATAAHKVFLEEFVEVDW